MPGRALLVAGVVAVLVAAGSARAQGSPQAPAARRLAAPAVAAFRLFGIDAPPTAPPPDAGVEPAEVRLLHQPGDPDSLFTLGAPTPHGEFHLHLAVELNDVILRAIAPDGRVDPRDTRPRAQGDFRALDERGRPYQLRLGARLVW